MYCLIKQLIIRNRMPVHTLSTHNLKQELAHIAALHVTPSVHCDIKKCPISDFRFFHDKVRLFHDFDPASILVHRTESGIIDGVLIYTHDETGFSRSAGGFSARLVKRAAKVLSGYYGFRFTKYRKSLRAMRGDYEHLYPGAEKRDTFGKIWVLIVAEESRRRGIAAELITGCIDAMQKRGRHCLRVTAEKENVPAVRAYEKCGFKKIGTCEESTGASYVLELAW